MTEADKPSRPKQTDRRQFMKTSAVVAAGAWVAGGIAPQKTYASPLQKVQFGCIGVGGKGASDSADAGRNGNVVAICDIDEDILGKAKESFVDAKTFYDYRAMLEEMGDKVDAVTVSTPDHTHAVAAIQAMSMGKHCFCQKPLTHSIEEARIMGELARQNKLVTQMGNQGTAQTILRRSAALIKSGAIGEVKHVHVWTNRPVWPQGIGVTVSEPGPKESVHWKEWIGPALTRPYSPEIHQFKWRGFWAFGTGALGDMACHTLNMAFMALNLRNPTSVKAESSEHDRVMYPKWSKIDFQFPELDGRPALGMTWYDGRKLPPAGLIKDLPRSRNGDGSESVYSSGALIVGTEGSFFSPGDYGADEQGNTGIMRPGGNYEKERRMELPEGSFKQSPGHFEEMTAAIEANDPSLAVSNFPDYAGPLTETILLGNLAVWAGGKDPIQWDAQKMIATNVPEEAVDSVNEMIRHTYHNGYDIRQVASAGRQDRRLVTRM